MFVFLLDNSLKIEVYCEQMDSEFEDNICVSFVEDCPEDEKLFRADETNMYLTPKQAEQLGNLLVRASKLGCKDLPGI
ncbi:MAG: hypothetical protein H6667_01195 [Ardenticatenaceae bacterium]|nr:hypothetical protein [Ardenticatenaceae bacterium]MCB9446384.1 hypothetical protein [Ardenticatenaceae bacterium]